VLRLAAAAFSALALLSVSGGWAGEHTSAAASCAVTKPNGKMPAGVAVNSDSYGSDALGTLLWPQGKVVFVPGGSGFILEDGSLSMKFPWWRGVTGKLTITGRRLDGAAPPLRARIPGGYGDTGFQASGIIFPTTGCWEVTGSVGEASLTFVTLVERVASAK